MVTCTGLLGVLFSVLFVRYIDRRTIMLVGVLACRICQLVPAKPATVEAGKVVVGFISLLTFFYVAYGRSSGFSCIKIILIHSFSSICLASRWRVPKQPIPRIRFWPGHRFEFSRQLVGNIHSSLLYQSC
jgi:hypothetical protein